MQSRYAQIEKELLAVVYDLERFHTYTYGKRSVCGIRPQASGSYFQEATASNSEEASAHAHASPVVQRQPWLQEGLHHVSGRHPKSGLLTLRWKPGCRFKDWEHQHDAAYIRLKPSTLQEIPDHTQKDNSLLELKKSSRLVGLKQKENYLIWCYPSLTFVMSWASAMALSLEEKQ